MVAVGITCRRQPGERRDHPRARSVPADYFSRFGISTDFQRALTRDDFHSVTHRWLDVFHIDRIRYDCVPSYWDGVTGVGRANLVYEAFALAKQDVAAGTPYWTCFDGGGDIRLVQCAEQLEALTSTCSTCTWQNATFEAARRAARGDRDQLTALGLLGYPDTITTNGDRLPRSALQ